MTKNWSTEPCDRIRDEKVLACSQSMVWTDGGGGVGKRLLLWHPLTHVFFGHLLLTVRNNVYDLEPHTTKNATPRFDRCCVAPSPTPALVLTTDTLSWRLEASLHYWPRPVWSVRRRRWSSVTPGRRPSLAPASRSGIGGTKSGSAAVWWDEDGNPTGGTPAGDGSRPTRRASSNDDNGRAG